MPDRADPVVEFDLTPEEWTEGVVAHLRTDPLISRAIRNNQLAYVLIWILISLLWLMGGSGLGAILGVIVGGLTAPILPPLTRALQRRHLEKVARRGIANGTFGPHRIELTDEGIVDTTEGYTLLTRWDAIERVEEAPDLFLIYIGPQAFIPVPTSAFRDSAQLRAFSDRFFEGLSGTNRLRGS